MAKNRKRIALVLASSMLVSGCGFISNLHLAHRSQDTPTSQSMATLYTEKGREMLRTGRTGEAIESFNYALATGEAPAPAYNGLGVAYSRIGRPDLSYRFFKKATMSDPGNPVYASNLDRLVKSPQFTLDMSPDFTGPISTPSQANLAASADQGPGNAGTMVQARVRSAGPRQVNIVTLSPTQVAATNGLRRPARQGCLQARSGRRDCEGGGAIQVVTRRKLPAEAKPVSADKGGDVAGADPAPAASTAPKRKVIDMRAPTGNAPARNAAAVSVGKS